MRLAGKSVVITGAGSGIGRSTATLFAKEGARLALVDRNEAAAAETAATITRTGGDARGFACDVGDEAAVTATASDVVATFDGIDVLVTAAGFSCGGTVMSTSPDDWNAVFRTNVGGTWLWARAAIPSMQQRGGGSIVTIASQLAIAGGRGNSAYIASKGAILSLTRTMALDFADDQIRINAIAPGAIETPMLIRSFARHTDAAAVRETSRKRHALQRFGKPEEIAEAALYLASDAARFTTGTTLVVDGGWLAA